MSIVPNTLQISNNQTYALGGVDLCGLAKTYQTPLYVLDVATFRANCRHYTEAMRHTYPDAYPIYAAKANLNVGIVNLLIEEGLGLDVVSGGELYTALQTAMPREKILFHGNNKGIEELRLAIQNEILIVVDNLHELTNIQTVSEVQSQKARVLLRLNPGIVVNTHHHIQTGHRTAKFGLDVADIDRAVQMIKAADSIQFLGIHSHLGSQLFDKAPFEDMIEGVGKKMVHFQEHYQLPIQILNIGGGIGIRYTKADPKLKLSPFIEHLCTTVKRVCDEHHLPHPQLIMEPGRSIVGEAGMTLYTVGAIKPIETIKTYCFVDGGMADNPRPAMYQAKHSVAVMNKANQPAEIDYTIAGKYCESGDILIDKVTLPELAPGDILGVFGTGAYNYSMASNYNHACKSAMVAVENGDARLLVKRESYEDLLRNDVR